MRARVRLIAVDAGRAFGLSGGIEAVHAAMARHADNAAVMAQCCFAIHSISLHDDCASELVQRQSIAKVIDILNRFPLDPDVQEHGCWSIFNLTRDGTRLRACASE